ncbi:MAG: DedA family protein [Candidatus Dojkabacteria bacterium]
MISSIIDWLVNLIESIGYPGVGIAMFIESFFAPIPSELILPFSGFVASNGSLNIYLVIVVASISAYIGSLPFYIIGRWGNSSVIRFIEKYGKYLFISKDDLDKGFQIFERYGNGIVFLGRLIPIVRTVISFPAGVAKMKFGLFTLYTLLGTAIWSSILALAGFYLGSKWEIVSVYVGKYENVIIVVLVVAIVVYILWSIRRNLNRSNK